MPQVSKARRRVLSMNRYRSRGGARWGGRGGRTGWFASLLMFLGFAVGGASAQDTWRLAGTFNGWNTSDDGWAMRASADQPGVFVIDRHIEPGSYEFKFVKNGDWGAGHFGVAVAGGTGGGAALDQPGADIVLSVAVPGIYRITLDLSRRSWSFDVGQVDRATLITKVSGSPRLRGPSIRVDASPSMLPVDAGPGRTELRLRVTEGAGQVRSTGVAMSRIVVPTDPGRLVLAAELVHAGEVVDQQELVFEVPREFISVLTLGTGRKLVVLEPSGGGKQIAAFDLERAERGVSVELHSTDRKVSLKQEFVAGTMLEPGRYVVEVDAAGEAVLRGDDGSGWPTLLRSGHWQDFELPWAEAGGASRVYLVGDFNDWAGPGQPGAIEMVCLLDQRFAATVPLARGAYRYGFLLDGYRVLKDGAVEAVAVGPSGREVSVLQVGPTPADFEAPVAGRLNEEAIHHDPASGRDFSAISSGLGLADLSVVCLPGDAERAWVRWRPVGGEDVVGGGDVIEWPMRRQADAGGFDRWGSRVKTGRSGFEYSFRLVDGNAGYLTPWYRANLHVPAEVDLPDWAKGAVWYQIFVERFRNGNPLNDPHGPGVFMMDWNANWYESQPGEEEQWRVRAGLKKAERLPARQGGPLYLWIWDRRYGGDLQGVVEKMDYLVDLGVTAIYFNPLFEADSMHKYDATDFRHIDDNFGHPTEAGRVKQDWTHAAHEVDDPASWGWTAADRYFLDVVIPEARKRGLRVVLDGVWNHTGRNFWAFQDVMKNGAKSKYADWFYCDFDDNGELIGWRAWDSPNGWLPKFRQQANGDLVEPVKKHIFDVTRRWMDPKGDGDVSAGVDGWRLDVPLDVGLPFWADWRRHVKSINPDAVIIAEIWQPADEFIRGNYFDTQMHYPFASAVVDWLGVKPGMSAGELGARFDAAFNDLPQTNLIHQNLLDSHDTDRVASMLMNPGRGYDQGNRPQDNGPRYDGSKPDAHAFAMARLAAVIQAAYMGAPMIYYGDELGMWGADDPTNRKPMVWPDLPANADPDEAADLETLDHYRNWFRLRQDDVVGDALRYGTVRHLDSGSDDVFVFVRELNDVQVIVAVNRGEEVYDAAAFAPAKGRGAIVHGKAASYWVRVGEEWLE